MSRTHGVPVGKLATVSEVGCRGHGYFRCPWRAKRSGSQATCEVCVGQQRLALVSSAPQDPAQQCLAPATSAEPGPRPAAAGGAPFASSGRGDLLRWQRLRQIGPGAGAVAEALCCLVAPQRLDRECLTSVAFYVAHRAWYRQHGLLRGQRILADPRALVADLVGVDRVVPAAEVADGQAATGNVLRARVGDRLDDLVTERDREAVQLALRWGIDRVLAAQVDPARVDRQ